MKLWWCRCRLPHLLSSIVPGSLSTANYSHGTRHHTPPAPHQACPHWNLSWDGKPWQHSVPPTPYSLLPASCVHVSKPGLGPPGDCRCPQQVLFISGYQVAAGGWWLCSTQHSSHIMSRWVSEGVAQAVEPGPAPTHYKHQQLHSRGEYGEVLMHRGAGRGEERRGHNCLTVF